MALAYSIKRYFILSALIAEILFFIVLYVHGSHGVYALQKVHMEMYEVKHDIALLENELHELETTLHAWHNHPFHKEKIAREQLQMARADDTVYYLT